MFNIYLRSLDLAKIKKTTNDNEDLTLEGEIGDDYLTVQKNFEASPGETIDTKEIAVLNSIIKKEDKRRRDKLKIFSLNENGKKGSIAENSYQDSLVADSNEVKIEETSQIKKSSDMEKIKNIIIESKFHPIFHEKKILMIILYHYSI